MRIRARYFVAGLAVLAIVYIFYKVFDYRQLAGIVSKFHPGLLLLYILIINIIDALLVLRWRMILASQKISIPFMRLYLYKQAAYAVGYVTPQMHIGDSSTRLLLLKKHDVNMKRGLTTILIDRAMSITTDALLALVGLAVVATSFPVPDGIRAIMLAISCFIGFSLGIFYYRLIRGRPVISLLFRLPLLRRLPSAEKYRIESRAIEKSMSMFFRKSRSVFIKTIFINVLLWVLMLAEYRTALMLFGFTATLLEVFLILSLIGLSYSLPVPFALGVLEAGQLSIFSVLGLPAIYALSLAFLVRAKDILKTIFGLSILSYFGVRGFAPVKKTAKKIH